MDPSGRVFVELPTARLEAGAVVLAAALNLLPRTIELELGLKGVVGDPVPRQVDVVMDLCDRLLPGFSRPLAIRGQEPSRQTDLLAAVVASDEPREALRAVLVLSAVAQAVALRPMVATVSAFSGVGALEAANYGHTGPTSPLGQVH